MSTAGVSREETVQGASMAAQKTGKEGEPRSRGAPKGRGKQKTREEPGPAGSVLDGPMQVALKEAWKGYRTYHGMVKNLTCLGLKGAVRERLVVQLRTNHASCFWLAGALTVCDEQLVAFGVMAQEQMVAGAIERGVSVVDAQALLAQSGVKLPLYWHNPELGDIDALGKGKERQGKAGPMHVLVDDEENLRPHWLPIVEPKEGESYKPPARVLRGLLGEQPKRGGKEKKQVKKPTPPGSRASTPTANFYDALEPDEQLDSDDEFATAYEPTEVGEQRQSERAGSVVESLVMSEAPAAPPQLPGPLEVGRLPDVPRPVRRPPVERAAHIRPGLVGPAMAALMQGQIRRANVPERFEWTFFDAAYGWEPPPCTRRGVGGTVTRWYLGNTDESCTNAVQYKESWWRRLTTLGCKTILWEARKEVLLGRFAAPGDWLYERVRGDHGTNPNLDGGGGVCLEAIETLECGASVYELGQRQEVVLPNGRRYKVAQLGRTLYVGGMARWVGTELGFTRDEVKRVGLRTQEEVALELRSLAVLPSEQAKVRALYSALVPLVPDELKGPVNDVRNEHLGLEKEEMMEIEPVEVVSSMVALNRSVRSRLQRVPAFGNGPKRSPKSCVSCGVEPVGKYRWKHRICTECSAKLAARGYTTYAGYQVQQNLHVPKCYPGIVKVAGEELPPKASKWALVDTGPGMSSCPCDAGVKCDVNVGRQKLSRVNAPKRWDDFEKRDLERLKVPLPQRFTHVLGGIGCSGARPMVSARSSYNCAKALLGRVFLKLPERPWSKEGGPKPGMWTKVRDFVPLLLPGFEAPRMAFHEWLETMPTRRRAALQRGWDRYERAGWLRSYGSFTSFVKTELLPGFGKIRGDLVRLEEMLDRAIHGPSEETHCIAGPIVKPYVRRLKEIWHREWPVFYGSATPEKLHLWLQDLVAEKRQNFWCDFSMYDRTHSLDSWAFVESLYDTSDPMFRRVLDAWRRPRGRFGPLKYQAPVCNASGRDDTALANALLNGFATYLSACAAWLQVDVEDITPEQVQGCFPIIRLSVCGDDSLGWLPLCSEERMRAFRAAFDLNIQKFGFVAKLCTSEEVDECVYLGMRPYPTKSGWFWGKTIGRASYKMGWMLEQQGRDPMAHVTGIADMHMLCSSHVPVLSDLARKIVELRQGARRTPPKLDPEKPWEWTYRAGVEYDEKTLEAVARVYSRRSTEGNPCEFEREVTVRDVQDLIQQIQSVERLPCVLDHWLWKHMIFSDDL